CPGAPLRRRRRSASLPRGLLPAAFARRSARPGVRRHDAGTGDRPDRMAGARRGLGAAARPSPPAVARSRSRVPDRGGVMDRPWLMAAAAGAARMLGAVPVAACFDALRGQVYGAVYVVDADAVETLVPPLVLTIDELAARSPQRPRVVVGDGAVRYADQVARWS